MKELLFMKWLVIMFAAAMFTSCYKDLGNYSYQEINEVTIDTLKERYSGYYLIDTIRISPEIHFTKDSANQDRYSYEWSLISGRFNGGNEFKISNERNLVFPVTVPANSYFLILKVLDKKTGVSWMQKSNLTVSTYFDQGWMILGEKEGYVTVDMVSIPGNGDTLLVKDVLQNSGLKPLQGPRDIISVNRFNNNPLYLLTDDGTYELDKNSFESGEYANIKSLVYDTEKDPNLTASDIVQNSGNYRYMIAGEKLYVNTSLIQANSFGNPASRYSTSKTSFKVAPYIAWSGARYGFVSGRMLAYNTEEQRFVQFTSTATFCDSLPDNPGDPFEWKTGLDMVNLFNSQYVNPALGKISYSLMKSDENKYYLYSFSTNIVRKGNKYDVSDLPEIGNMTGWGFSGSFPIMFYAAGTKLYGYNYETGQRFEREFEKEITMLHFDTYLEGDEVFYVATWDSAASDEDGGEITKFRVKRNPNNIEIEKADDVQWSGLSKVKSMTWKWF